MRFRNIAWLLPLLFCCCNKQSTNGNGTNTVPLAFTATYDSVYTCYPYTNVTVSFMINVTAGDITKSPVTVALSGLPSNMQVIPPSFTITGMLGGAFTVSLGNVPPGIDTVNISFTSAAQGTRVHKLIFNVLTPVDYAPKLADTYDSSYDFCQPDSFFHYSSVVTTVTDTPYLIKISNIKNLGAGLKVRAWLSNVMGSNKITMPVQTLGAYTIWGSGTYFHDIAPYDTLYQTAIHDTLVLGVDTQYCTIHLQH